MRIAIDVTASMYQGSGVATYYKQLVPQLLQLGKEHEFITFGYSLRRRKDLKLAQMKFPFPPKLMGLLWNNLHKFPVETLVGDCDIVHSWDYIQPPTKRAKIVTTIHDLTPIKFPALQHRKTISAYKAGLRWVKKEAVAIVTDSESTKKDIEDLLKIPNGKIHVIYLAASKKFHEFQHRNESRNGILLQQVLNKYDIKGNYILSVGTREPRKNIKRVIEAHQKMDLQHKLVIVGKYGWGSEHKTSEKVKILGFVPNRDLPALYLGASCMVYPSLYEGFGLPVLEAMAVGCPVVTSKRGSLKEITEDAAIHVDPESVQSIAFGINTALMSASKLSQNGKTQAKKFSWEKTARETIKVYESVVKINS